jgi:serine/threonine protein kinase
LIDWDWVVRITDFSHSVVAAEGLSESNPAEVGAITARYSSPESFDGALTLESDVFSFGLILYEILSGETGFPGDFSQIEMMKKIVLDKYRPPIPDYFCNDVKELINDCWAQKSHERPSFGEILYRLDRMDFQITPGVKSVKVRRFADAVKAREKELGIEIDDFD